MVNRLYNSEGWQPVHIGKIRLAPPAAARAGIFYEASCKLSLSKDDIHGLPARREGEALQLDQDAMHIYRADQFFFFWAQHIFSPRPFGVVLQAKIDLWGPLGASGRGQKAHFLISFEHICWSSLYVCMHLGDLKCCRRKGFSRKAASAESASSSFMANNATNALGSRGP